ncbi:heme NO-binding domain-containing protein [Pseudenhygromyxa sp. WMMC2535]|uniref:heme NO-binding domain-containing protein n=1 Tax=Pseudenhygromyxa sp. WMMC2535 TaxID=2712867 RepID=UPI001553219D|nr:heme NO-binding domain-containing protein [Pseudenhygromyxa sp. WMMC2535]NVB36204.1 heme NO-binding domain-containing protein [Pseudenhygromyxa sp. WMMC2535]NVB43403.1 heme NO-binding domain-containing protein [Pseudenhygromyxa sp. WMMC2535]
MKGAFLKCIKELVITQHGEDQWTKILATSSYPSNKPIMATATVPDEQLFGVMKEARKILRMSKNQFYDAFADYWICIYGPRLSPRHYDEATNSREFLTMLDDIHGRARRRMRGATPPNIEMRWLDEDTVELTYNSERELILMMTALVRALGRYFDDDIERVDLIDDKTVHVGFVSIADDVSAAE